MSRSLVLQSSSGRSRDWEGDTFVIDQEATQIDDSTTNEILQFLYCANIDVYSVPAYRILWTHLAANYPNRGSLLELIPLAMKFSTHIDTNNLESIVVDEGVSDLYTSLIEDVASDHDCDIQYEKDLSSRSFLRSTQRKIWHGIAQPLMLLLNQLVSLINPISKVGNKPMVIFPFPGRYDSTLPVAQELKDCSECLIPHLGANLFNSPDTNYDIPLKSYQEYSTSSIILREISVWSELFRSKKRRKFNKKLTSLIDERFQISLPKTIRNSSNMVFDINIRPLLYYCWASEFFSENEISAAMVGGQSPRDLSILEAANENNVDTYYIHHSITTGNEFVPPNDATQFVPSDIGKDHIKDVYSGIDCPSLRVMGRPYFDKRYDDNDLISNDYSDTEEFIVLAATQPYSNNVRSKFIEDIYQACSSSELIDQIKIKIHPSESESYYEQILEELGDGESISIAGTNLEQEIASSSLVISINSNVGLESMIQGTPTICFNKWHPSIQNKPYTKSSVVPVLCEFTGLNEFLNSQTQDTISELADSQHQFACEQFLETNSASEAIAEHIRQISIVNN